MKNKYTNHGFSLIEMLVVMSVFSILAVVATQVLTLSLGGSRKSESLSEVRQNAQYALDVIDRLLRNARDISCTTSSATNRIDYNDEYGNPAYFQCITSGTDTYIASNSSSRRLTSNTVSITNCNQVFTCTNGVGVPDSIDIVLSATDTTAIGIDRSSVTVSTKILLRNY